MIDPDHPGSSSQIKTAELQRFLRKAQRMVGISGEVSVLVTSSAKMRRMNREFRGKDKSTDVLSFPAAQNGRVKIAGDIAISKEIARSNARALGHSLETELKVLLLHGLLHLAGHDHEKDQGKMASLEQELRAKLKLPTGLIERSENPRKVENSKGPAVSDRVFRSSRQASPSNPKHSNRSPRGSEASGGNPELRARRSRDSGGSPRLPVGGSWTSSPAAKEAVFQNGL